MDFLFDPTAWMGLATLVLIELVLGIDNLIFIAILAERLPPEQRDRARQIGLVLALLMRLGLLTCISWLASLTDPLLDVFGKALSGRDLILLVGGFFLLFKATGEIHARLEGRKHGDGNTRYKARFWMVVTQIIILDAVFSLDAVITAVGMTDHLEVMMLAVTIAILLMIVVSKPLTAFVNRHPTIVMLCLGFLLMVGFSLVAEGLGAHVPKGYLYAAIGFSILIEAFNQFAQARLKKRVAENPDARTRAADAILKILGARKADGPEDTQEIGVILQQAAEGDILSPSEKELLRGVLNLTERPVSTIMTPRTSIEWIDINESEDEVRRDMASTQRSQLLVSQDEIDNVLGVVHKEDFLAPMINDGRLPPLTRVMKEPLFVHENMHVITLLETFKKTTADLAVVIDEFGSVEGVITHQDLLEAIAGEFPEHEDEKSADDIVRQDDGTFIVDGMTSIYDLRDRTGFDYIPGGNFATMAGFVLHELARFPAVGERLNWEGWTLEVLSMDGKRIGKLRLHPPRD